MNKYLGKGSWGSRGSRISFREWLDRKNPPLGFFPNPPLIGEVGKWGSHSFDATKNSIKKVPEKPGKQLAKPTKSQVLASIRLILSELGQVDAVQAVDYLQKAGQLSLSEAEQLIDHLKQCGDCFEVGGVLRWNQ